MSAPAEPPAVGPDPSVEATARYVFSIAFRLESGTADLAVEPARLETTLYKRADPPGRAGWRFFRDHLWRGELANPDHFRDSSPRRWAFG